MLKLGKYYNYIKTNLFQMFTFLLLCINVYLFKNER